MAADRCSRSSFKRCEEYTKWKRSFIVRLHDWAYRSHRTGGQWAYPPNRFMRMCFRTLWLIKNLCAKKRAPHILTPEENIIVGLMLVGQYERHPHCG